MPAALMKPVYKGWGFVHRRGLFTGILVIVALGMLLNVLDPIRRPPHEVRHAALSTSSAVCHRLRYA